MIKGVNKQIVEINNPQNEYFEKAILYVKPSKQMLTQKELSSEAAEYLNQLSPKKRSLPWSKIFIVIGCGSAVAGTVLGILLHL